MAYIHGIVYTVFLITFFISCNYLAKGQYDPIPGFIAFASAVGLIATFVVWIQWRGET